MFYVSFYNFLKKTPTLVPRIQNCCSPVTEGNTYIRYNLILVLSNLHVQVYTILTDCMHAI